MSELYDTASSYCSRRKESHFLVSSDESWSSQFNLWVRINWMKHLAHQWQVKRTRKVSKALLNSRLRFSWNIWYSSSIQFYKKSYQIPDSRTPVEKHYILRHLFTDSVVTVGLHGFSGASELGFSASVYVRCVDSNGGVRINLIFAKSRGKPLQRVTLPRLEINGAHILAKMLHYCKDTFSNQLKINSYHDCSDCTVALAWIYTPPHRWKTYIAIRVAQIQ